MSVLVLRVHFLDVQCHIVFLWGELVTAWQKLCPQRNTMWLRLFSWLILPTGNDTYTEVPMCGIRAQHFMLDMILVSTCMYSALSITYKEIIFSRFLSDSYMLVCQIQGIKVAQDPSLWITQDLFVSECLLEVPMYVSTKHRLRPSFHFMGNSEIYERLAYNYQIDRSIPVSQGLPSLMMISRFPPGCFGLDLRQ